MDALSRKVLIIANVAMIAAITLHDLYHIRQARGWCYTITALLWVINGLVYIPGIFALVASVKRARWAPFATAFVSAGPSSADCWRRWDVDVQVHHELT